MIESESIQRITNMLVQGRSECSTHTLDQAKMLRLVVQRMSERRLKIKRLEKKRLEILGRGEFETDIQSKNNDMAMDEIDRRIKLERDSMKRDEAFAREITENVAGELSGL